MASELVYDATLTRRIDVSETLAIFRVKPDVPPPLDSNGRWFDAGQYVVLGLDHRDPAVGGVRRPMTLASPPQEAEILDFYIKYVGQPGSENPLTHQLWAAREGARVHCRTHATGRFTIEACVGREDPRIRVLVGAGTGLAPFVSMIEEQVRRDAGADLSRWVVMHGASYRADLGYHDRLGRLAADNGLRYLPTISRPPPRSDWSGATGRVEDFLMEGRVEALEETLGLGAGGLRPDAAFLMVCGLSGTIRETILRTLGRGFVPNNRRIRRALGVDADTAPSLFFEQYDPDPVLDVRDPDVIDELKRLFASPR